ncbi:MAG: isoaspartyl peptidase/L-asparaginase [Chitinophagaceae bacterium]|nr:isoaspartyl peptidase/L-asparaginase [Chitinophagaceae bacterium]MBK8607418.1 isoaspartyl peptidase/L-asparaginase [Chitinophagaceae bacterium]MBP7108864.1 isoaspartyl peptidase/L-asparaginase [Chitinophagaceae bacterium]MBP7315869.1 isoaspartyl peptidase/L-asparaginase [Chitinophagaceae bacterium]HQX96393.1 isoaspartyl peptidase/L-asparaginase [Chitinophagaceae bacterium]
MSTYTLVIHGGAGTILKKDLTNELEAAYRKGLEDALKAGYALLEKGKTAVEAVLAATISLENNILFNAGKGSVFGKDGRQEMDASIMDGKNLMAGAVSAVRNVRNPVELAHAIMNKSQHVMLNGNGALEFAKEHGLQIEEDEYFYSAFRYEQWKQMQGSNEVVLDHNVVIKDKKFGTVGAAAMDIHGNIAAATSTGGMTNKQYGRVGDSPIIGAGTYANNKTCAISCTGHGEPFIRAVTAYDVSCLMEYKGLSLEDAMKVVVHDKLMKIDGEGGMIGVDAKGNTALVFNSEGMYRGVRRSDGQDKIAIYK